MRWLYSIILAGIIMPTAVQAAVINYDEAIDGDIPDDFFGLETVPVFNLGIGENTFSGEVTLRIDPTVVVFGNLSDYDSFGFNIPNNSQLKSIVIDTSLLPGSPEGFVGTGYQLIDAQLNLISRQEEGSVSIPTTNASLFDAYLPLNSGKFFFRNSSLAYKSEVTGDNYSATATYKVAFNVQSKPIPEPSSTLGLAVIGSLGAFSLFNRKIKRRVIN